MSNILQAAEYHFGDVIAPKTLSLNIRLTVWKFSLRQNGGMYDKAL